MRRRESSSNPALRIIGGSWSDKTLHEKMNLERSTGDQGSSSNDNSDVNNTNHESTDVLELYRKSLIDNVQVLTVNSDN